MKNASFVFIILLTLYICGCVENHKAKARELWQEGRVALAEDDFNRAAGLFMRAVDYDPSNVRVHMSLQDEMLRKHQEQLAKQTYYQLYSKNRNKTWAVFLYLRVADDLDSSEKRKIFEKAKAKDPLCGWIYYGLACLEFKENNFDKARTNLEKALISSNEIPEAYIELGRIYGNEKQIAKAEACFKTALDMDPFFDEAYFYSGNIELIKGNFEEAEELYKKAYSLDKRDAKYGNAIAKIAFLQKKYDEAERILSRLVEEDPSDSRYLISLARVAFMTKNFDRAEDFLAKAFELQRYIDEIQILKIALAISRDDRQRAYAEFYIAEKFNPKSEKLKKLKEIYEKTDEVGQNEKSQLRNIIMKEYLKI